MTGGMIAGSVTAGVIAGTVVGCPIGTTTGPARRVNLSNVASASLAAAVAAAAAALASTIVFCKSQMLNGQARLEPVDGGVDGEVDGAVRLRDALLTDVGSSIKRVGSAVKRISLATGRSGPPPCPTGQFIAMVGMLIVNKPPSFYRHFHN